MSAILYEIKARQREHDLIYCSFEQFTVDEGTSVSAQIVIDERVWHPYCIDDTRQRVIFTEIPTSVNLTEKAFAFQHQFSEARRLLAVPYEELLGLARQATMPETLIFIFSTGRCGSTLLNQIFNEIDGVNSLSEPDIPTNLTALRMIDPSRDKLYADILYATTRLQVHALMTPDTCYFGLKFRGQALELMDLYYQQFPDARYLFMYRHATQWARSMYSFVKKFGIPDMLNSEMTYMMAKTSGYSTVNKMAQYIDLSRSIFYIEEGFAVTWLHMMDMYLEAFKSGIPLFPLRYEDLTEKREILIPQLLEYCGIPTSYATQAMKGFDMDSQRGTILAQDVESERISVEQIARFQAVLQGHPVVKSPDFRLPSC